MKIKYPVLGCHYKRHGIYKEVTVYRLPGSIGSDFVLEPGNVRLRPFYVGFMERHFKQQNHSARESPYTVHVCPEALRSPLSALLQVN